MGTQRAFKSNPLRQPVSLFLDRRFELSCPRPTILGAAGPKIRYPRNHSGRESLINLGPMPRPGETVDENSLGVSAAILLRVLYWECKRRLENLREFRGLVADYIHSLGFMSGSGRAMQTDKSQPIRDQINLSMRDALESCQQVGESMTVLYTSRGYQAPLNLLRELFDLRNAYHISPAKALDGLDRAIGEYERRKQRLYWQMFNPLFWLQLLLVKIIGIPFQILGAAGFDAAKIEETTAGRVVKAIVGFVAFAAAFLTVLQLLGWLDPIIGFVHAMKSSR